jgi:hypothetical protein
VTDNSTIGIEDELRQPPPRRLSMERRLIRQGTLLERMGMVVVSVLFVPSFWFMWRESRETPSNMVGYVVAAVLLTSPVWIGLLRQRARIRRLCREGTLHAGRIADLAMAREVGEMWLRVESEGLPRLIVEANTGIGEVKLGDAALVVAANPVHKWGLAVVNGRGVLGRFDRRRKKGSRGLPVPDRRGHR